MELFFNELSLVGKESIDNNAILELIKVYRSLRQLEHSWIYDGRSCIGLALASILNSASLSIYATKWNTEFVDILKDDNINVVRNIWTERHVDIHIPQLQLDEEPELIETDLRVEDKRISLRHDHGMDVLTEFSKRLVSVCWLSLF